MDTRYSVAAFYCAILCASPLITAHITTQQISNSTSSTDIITTQTGQSTNETNVEKQTAQIQVNTTIHGVIEPTRLQTTLNLNEGLTSTEIIPLPTHIVHVSKQGISSLVTTKVPLNNDITTTATAVSVTKENTYTNDVTTQKPENCMKSRAANFTACFEALGKNAMKYIASQDLIAFLADICNPDQSRPYMECIKRHFTECPDFQNRIEVKLLQFGPYHIKDIIFFSTVEQMCTCAPGLICIQELIKIKRYYGLTEVISDSPWEKLPNYEQMCENDTVRYIGCVRKNLRQCQIPLTKRYQDDFTNEDAENLKRMYDFTKEHCDTVKHDDFKENYKCIHEKSRTSEINACVKKTDRLSMDKQICQMRDCVTETLDSQCDKGMVGLYIDAVNIYRHTKSKILNNPCSSGADIGISVMTVIITFVIVLLL